MRFLGIDYGKKRIGIAISDEGGKLAFPKETLANDLNLFKNLTKIIEEENVTEIVIGESVDFDGKANEIMKEVSGFIDSLKKNTTLPIFLEKEFLTSVEARKHKNFHEQSRIVKKNNEKVDASAAALILQRYLDKKNNFTNLLEV